MSTTPPSMGMIGFLFDSSQEPLPAADCPSICAMAEDIRTRIMQAFAQMQLCPDRAVEIDGEKWEPDRVYRALMELYEWTYKACRKEEPQAVALVSSVYSCGRNGC